MAQAPKLKQHTFKYVKIDGFRTDQIHGVYGGINLRGQLNINFYIEAPDLAKSTHAPIVGQQLGKEVFAPSGESSTVRELHYGVNIDIPIAKEMIRWMEEHIKNFETLQANALLNTQNK